MKQYLSMAAKCETDICGFKGLIIRRQHSQSSLLSVLGPGTDVYNFFCQFLCGTASWSQTLES